MTEMKAMLSKPFESLSLIERLRTRAYIRRQNMDRKSVREGKKDRVADLLEEAANELERKGT